ncbi:MAG: BMP family ABC transporter substrate-binding protein [Caldilineales bacterium]
MQKRLYLAVAFVLVASMLLAACGGAATPAPTAAPVEPVATTAPAEPAAPMAKFSVGQVTDVGGIDDKSFNQTAWKGVQDAITAFGVDGVYLESQQQTDYEKNLNEFVSQKKDLIITVGFLLADATKAAAEANPDSKFAIIDSPSSVANVKGLLFDTSQPSFLAGYLAAGMSETGTVCTYGGINIPPVVEFMIGFTNGVGYYNSQNKAEVTVLGWDNAAQDGTFAGNFESTDDGRRLAEVFFDEGCDVIMPVAGPVGLGSAAAAKDRGLMIIGVDTDQYVSSPEFAEVWLSSVQKNMDKAVYDSIGALVDGSLTLGDNYTGTLANGGVGLAPYHDFESKVPAELSAEIAAVTQGIIDGKIDTRAAVAAAPASDKTFTVGEVTDVGGIDDKGFNQTAWKGVEDAVKAFGVEGVYLESQQQTDYEKNLNEFISQKKDLIVTVGFLLADATKAAAEASPDSKFAIIDSPSSAANVKGLLFDVAQPSFLAGYLAAGMSETGTVCTYGGINIPPVVEFMIGFTNGVGYYNSQNKAEVTVLGWDNAAQDGTFAGNFESTDDGRRLAEVFFDEGCDVIFPVAGPVGLGSAAAAKERDLMMIGVDTDQYLSAPEFGSVFLSSVLKNMDKGVYDTISAMIDGSLTLGDNYTGTLANGGVGLASYHDFESKVPAELTDQIKQVMQDIIDGKIDPKAAQ